MDEDLKWLIGIAVTLFLFWGSMLGAAFWRIMGTIRKVEEAVEQGDKELHARINRVREDTVRKSDLTDLSVGLRDEMKEMRQEYRKGTDATNTRLDVLLAAVANRNNHSGQK